MKIASMLRRVNGLASDLTSRTVKMGFHSSTTIRYDSCLLIFETRLGYSDIKL